jgi:hypothetical protein
MANAQVTYTTTLQGHCTICGKNLDDVHVKCGCGAVIVNITMQPKQQQLLDAILSTGPNVATKWGYGGSRGSGKSRGARDIVLAVASLVSQTLPGIVIFIIRRNWTDVDENHRQKYLIERPLLAANYSNKEFQFPPGMNSPRIAFKYGDTLEDIRRVARGPECYLMVIDQAEQFSELELAELNTPNRWPAAGPGGAKTLYLFNPGGPGSDYLQRVFFKKKFKDNENPEDFNFVQAYGWDNWSAWFANEGIEVDGKPLTWESFYALPGDLPPCPNGAYNRAWLESIPDNHRFKLFVTRTSEGRKMWSKPESIRMGDLFGRFDAFAGQYMAGIFDERRVVLR